MLTPKCAQVVDHILELQVVVDAFKDENKNLNDKSKAISDKAWKKAQAAVNGDDQAGCKKVAEQVSKCNSHRSCFDMRNLIPRSCPYKPTGYYRRNKSRENGGGHQSSQCRPSSLCDIFLILVHLTYTYRETQVAATMPKSGKIGSMPSLTN